MLTALRGRVSGTALADADRQGGTMPEAAAAFLETCRLWWHLVTTWPYSLLWSLAVPGTVSAFLRKKRPMIPYRRARAVVTWILASGFAKTIERTLFSIQELDSSTWPRMHSSSDPEFRTELYLAPSTGFGGFLGAFVEPRDNPVHLPVFAGRVFAGAIPDDPTRVKLTLTYGEEPTSITFFLITQTSPTP